MELCRLQEKTLLLRGAAALFTLHRNSRSQDPLQSQDLLQSQDPLLSQDLLQSQVHQGPGCFRSELLVPVNIS